MVCLGVLGFYNIVNNCLILVKVVLDLATQMPSIYFLLSFGFNFSLIAGPVLMNFLFLDKVLQATHFEYVLCCVINKQAAI